MPHARPVSMIFCCEKWLRNWTDQVYKTEIHHWLKVSMPKEGRLKPEATLPPCFPESSGWTDLKLLNSVWVKEKKRSHQYPSSILSANSKCLCRAAYWELGLHALLLNFSEWILAVSGWDRTPYLPTFTSLRSTNSKISQNTERKSLEQAKDQSLYMKVLKPSQSYVLNEQNFNVF